MRFALILVSFKFDFFVQVSFVSGDPSCCFRGKVCGYQLKNENKFYEFGVISVKRLLVIGILFGFVSLKVAMG